MILQLEMRPRELPLGLKSSLLRHLAATSGSVVTATAGQGRCRDNKRKRLSWRHGRPDGVLLKGLRGSPSTFG